MRHNRFATSVLLSVFLATACSETGYTPQDTAAADEPAETVTEDAPIDETAGEDAAGEPRADEGDARLDLPGDPPAEEEGTGECGWVRIVDLGGETLNVRASPSLSAAVVATLGEGAVVEVTGSQRGDTVSDSSIGRSSDLWYRIASGSTEGWITSIYTECTEEPDPGEALDWVWPVTGGESLSPWRTTCAFGCSWGSYHGHLGEDYTTGDDIGKPIFAAADGLVVHVYRNIGNYKDIIIIRHDLPAATSAGDASLFSRYGHTGAEISEGASVAAGQRIGHLVDPVDFGPHLHFEIVNGAAQEDGPFCRGCEAAGIDMGPGYAGYDFSGGSIDFLDPTGDGVTGNRFYKPSRVITTDGRL